MVANALELLSPLSGPVVPLERVPDPVFAAGMLGDGLAIEPLSGRVVAPCDGVVTSVHRAGHALTLLATNGAEVLVHVGVDTVQLAGRGFTPRVASGARVRAGESILAFDLDDVARVAPSVVTIVLVTNVDRFAVTWRTSADVRAGTSPLFAVRPRDRSEVSRAHTDTAAIERIGTAVVRHGGGLHARPAALVVEATRRHGADVRIERDGRSANAASVVALMALGAAEGDQVMVRARGEDAEAALTAVVLALETATRAEPDRGTAPAPVAARKATPDGGELVGVRAAPGLAVGRVVHLDAAAIEIPSGSGDVHAELDGLARALAQARDDVGAALARAEARGARAERDIFAAHKLLLEDPDIVHAAERAVTRGQGAAAAIHSVIGEQCAVLASTGHALLAERAADLRELERRVLGALGAVTTHEPVLFESSILVADDLTVAELTRLPPDRVAGVCTARGGATSHVAIVARSLGVPALVAAGEGVLRLEQGTEVLLDADAGFLDPNPTPSRLAWARAALAERAARRAEARASLHRPATLRDGTSLEVAANVATVAETERALAQGADAVGLLRTELLFVDRAEAPSVDEQRAAYQAVVDALEGRPAIIRTLDAGGDKPLPFLVLPPEENPALGLRGIRSSLARPDLLDTQLRALLGVRPLSACRILLPMVTDLPELEAVRARIDELARELGVQERPSVGVMIEVPSAALLAAQLARGADFFSIGTNDLTQYTLAMDRGHPSLASRADGLHPAVLQLVARTVEGARRFGRWVGVCGALAADLDAVPILVGLGVQELSVSPGAVADVKARIRSLDRATCEAEARAALERSSAAEIRSRVQALWPDR